VLRSTFQIASGVGPLREQRLWRAGIACWDDYLAAPHGDGTLTGRADRALRAAIAAASAAFDARDAEALAALLPSGEQWRLYPELGEDAAYLDIETGDDVVGFEGISAIGVLDRRGPRLFLGGRDLQDFPEAARDWSMLVTFNGGSFDLPILRRAFPDWRPPRCHLDLRHLLARAGWEGGLKAIERALGLRRPDHLDGVGGWDACWLWRRGCAGDGAALRLFAEYNLYDVIGLRTLAAVAYNALVDDIDAAAVRDAAPRVPVPGRGDVLYDVSKILLAL
jgi:uncharacterized protein YprB with RNaseH-like and TPR domain